MSRSKSSFWKCPKCGRTFRARSAYHLKHCKGTMRAIAFALLALSFVGCDPGNGGCVEEVPLKDCPELPFDPAECAEIYPGSDMVLMPECAGPIYGFRLGRAECSFGTVEVWCE